ncbi:hypothetical protein [Marinospirillum minutulum]|uniref:hypothetical protein n=1 Tax=Marinospirillum minutulum TaxID=64974 RepID=UPI000408569D|nr:hypothetical protein [Marinospirillum minutulum]
MANGELAPDTAAQFISSVGMLARVVEIDELQQRLEALERTTTTANNDTMKLITLSAPEQQINGLAHSGEHIKRQPDESLDVLQQRAVARWYTGQPIVCAVMG